MWSDSDDEVVPVFFNIIELCEQEATKTTPSREYWVHPYNRKRDAEDTIKKLISELRKYPETFKNFIRMQVSTFDNLLALIEKRISKQDTNYRKCISAAERLFITLRFLATGESFKSLSYQFRCGASTIEGIVEQTIKTIWEILSPIYLPKPDALKWISTADAFGKMWNFPNCLGAIGEKYIRLKCPPNTGSQMFNTKKLHSIQLQAVVDAHGQFIWIDVGDFERNNDTDVFKHSNFGKKLYNNELDLPNKQKLCDDSDEYFPFVFVADERYPLLTNVMKPFPRKHLTTEARIYNYRLSRARRVAECAFGMLTKKFCIFESVILLAPNKVRTITLAACALHNMIRESENLLQEIYTERDVMEEDLLVVQTETNQSTLLPESSKVARNVRNQFLTYFNSSAGSVPWQLKYARLDF